MHLSNDTLDLIDSEFDVALRIGHLPDSNLVARRLAGFRTQVFASPAYIERHGEPLHPDDLQHHRTLSFSKFRRNNGYCWPLSDGGRTQEFRIDPVLVTNDPGPLTGTLLCGEGLMLSSDLTIKPYVEQGLARRVLAGWTGPQMELNAVFPRGRVQSPKVRAFVDFLVERLTFEVNHMKTLCPNQREACEAAAQATAMIGAGPGTRSAQRVAVDDDADAIAA